MALHCLPFLFVSQCFRVKSTEETGAAYWSLFTLKQFVYGPLIGGLVGWAGGYLVEIASKREWMNHMFQRLASIAIAILAFSLAEMAHGNGFIAAFFAGMLLGHAHERNPRDVFMNLVKLKVRH